MTHLLLLAALPLAAPAPEVLFDGDPAQLENWVLDGEADLAVADGVLSITARTAMVFWTPAWVTAPSEIEFEARTDDAKCRAILFFAAKGLETEDIFEWERAGEYGDYAYADTMELYTVGLLRDATGTPSNLRRLGGILPERFQILRETPADLDAEGKRKWKEAFDAFQPYSIRSDAPDGTELETWHAYRVRQDPDGRVRVWVDERLVHDYVEPENPLLQGRFGFRNFGKGTALLIRQVRVSTAAQE